MPQEAHNGDCELEVYRAVSRFIAEEREQDLVPYVRQRAKDGSVLASHIKAFGKSQMARGFFSLPFFSELIYAYLAEQLSRGQLTRDLEPYESYNIWQWSWLIEAGLVAYRRTDDTRFLDLLHSPIAHALRHRDCDRGLTDQVRNRIVNSWGLFGHVPETWTTVATVAGRMTPPILDYLDACARAGRPTPANWVEACRAAVDEHVGEFAVSDDGQEGLFNRPTRGDVEPLNHAASLGRALVRLGRRYPQAPYRRMAEQLARFFRNSLFEEHGSYAWAYRPTLTDRRAGFPTTFWKADVDICFVRDCVDAGIVFGERDLDWFWATLGQAILRPGWLNCYVSRRKLETLDTKATKIGIRCYGLCSWMILADRSAELEGLLEEALFANRQYVSGGWLAGGRAPWAYCLKREPSAGTQSAE